MVEDVTGILLAGGRARRMSGRDKGLVQVAGEAMAARVARRLGGQVARLVINANRHLADYAVLGWPVQPDTLPDHPGPLAGVLAVATHHPGDWFLTVPCDTPFLPLDLAARLMTAARDANVPLARAADGQRAHFTIMLVHRALLADLEAWLVAGGGAVQTWQARHPGVDVVFPDSPLAFLNINTPADVRRAEALLEAGEIPLA